jgi:hypothetical protein
MSSGNLRTAVLGTAVAMVIGGIGTWATGFGQSVNGFDRDGAIVIVCAVLIGLAVVVAKRALAILAAVAALASAATAIYDLQDIQGKIEGISVGWGLWLSVVASVVAVLLTVALVRDRSGGGGSVTGPA